jgi:hypothetical protein
MLVTIVTGPSGHHNQIGLGLGLVVEGHRRLEPHDPSRRKDGSQGIVDRGDRARVIRSLGLGDHELATDELDGLAMEHSQVDEPIVLGALPPLHR